jgi:hypothetical protein
MGKKSKNTGEKAHENVYSSFFSAFIKHEKRKRRTDLYIYSCMLHWALTHLLYKYNTAMQQQQQQQCCLLCILGYPLCTGRI